MRIYHGCSDSRRESVLKNGIEPRGDRPSMWQSLPSHKAMVYLTDTYPFFFTNTGGEQQVVVFEIDTDVLDEGNFFPDEDYLVQIAGKIGIGPREGKTVHDEAIERLTEFRDLWKASLEQLGTCCYHGTIPVTALTRYCRFDRQLYFGTELQGFFTDPVIGIAEHARQAGFQQRLLRMMFGDCHELPPSWQNKCAQRKDAPGIEVENLR